MLPLIAKCSAIGKCVAACVFVATALCITAHADVFDKPSRKIVVNLGKTPNTVPPRAIALTCWFYPGFVIKQLDDPSLKGADWIAVIPTERTSRPSCKRSHEPGERYLSRNRTEYLGGYFKGVKDQLVFLDAPDGMNGGIFFVAYDWKSGNPVFQDTALFWDGYDLRSDLRNNVRFSRTSDGLLVLHYRRVVESKCSIPLEGIECWTQVRRNFHLPSVNMPKCTGYRYPGMQGWTPQNPVVLDELDAHSVFTYPVEAVLAVHPSIKSVSGRITCSAVE